MNVISPSFLTGSSEGARQRDIHDLPGADDPLNPVSGGKTGAGGNPAPPEGFKEEAKQRVIDIFRAVGIPEPEKRYKSYPHQLSGGLRQRVMIGMAWCAARR